MALEDDIRDRFKADATSILEDNLDRVDGHFEYHDDGTIQLDREINEADREIQILVYLIAKRLMFEANDAEEPTLPYSYFYEKYSVDESTVRGSVKNLRDSSFITSESGEHEIIVENLPNMIDYIEEELD